MIPADIGKIRKVKKTIIDFSTTRALNIKALQDSIIF